MSVAVTGPDEVAPLQGEDQESPLQEGGSAATAGEGDAAEDVAAASADSATVAVETAEVARGLSPLHSRRYARMGRLTPIHTSHLSNRQSFGDSGGDSEADGKRSISKVIAGVRTVAESGGPGTCQTRLAKEATYTELLVQSPQVQEYAAQKAVGLECLKELATVFAELDGSLEGIVPAYTVRTLLRRLGRDVQARAAFELVERALELRPPGAERQGLDFYDVINVVAHQAGLELEALRRAFELRSSDRPLEFREVAKVLEAVGVHPRLEQLRRIALDLQLTGSGELNIALSDVGQLVRIAERCYELEKQRAHERAGFSHDQVCYFQDAFERVAKSARVSELCKADLLRVLELVGVAPASAEERQNLEEMIQLADRDENGTFSFEECLHLLRRYLDETEFAAVLHEVDAAEEAGLSREELTGLRQVYKGLAEETSGTREFSYAALTQAIQLLGASITMEQNAALERIFRESAEVSKAATSKQRQMVPISTEALQLPFPQFLKVIGRLWREDFAGILQASERSLLEEREAQPKLGAGPKQRRNWRFSAARS